MYINNTTTKMYCDYLSNEKLVLILFQQEIHITSYVLSTGIGKK